ncbi:hypothetical protein CNMCM7691_008583 [Aspergillus felis]|uniref:Uncharacterized protein n=1 Tax=Aspergillus felis TaxID=1287682 RepID=A0A8H6V2F1_9EURO|nr:hypothetical protein CNMCM7691_008583 [Aspergillus felis]
MELVDVRVYQAVVFNSNDNSGIEVQTTVSHIVCPDPIRIAAYFTLESCAPNQTAFQLVASCNLNIYRGEPSPKLLPASKLTAPHMIHVPEQTFHSAVAEQEYGYSGVFKGLSSLKRKLSMASSTEPKIGATAAPAAHGEAYPMVNSSAPPEVEEGGALHRIRPHLQRDICRARIIRNGLVALI